jgi:biotin transporter BioY
MGAFVAIGAVALAAIAMIVYVIGMAVLQYFLMKKFEDKKLVITIIFAVLNLLGCAVVLLIDKIKNDKKKAAAESTSAE